MTEPTAGMAAATALILARVFGNSRDFWLNVQRRGDLWEATHSPGSGLNARVRSKPLNPPAATASANAAA